MSRVGAIDTTAMLWEDMPGIPGFKRRRLRVDQRCGGSVEIQYAPPGYGEVVQEHLRRGAIRHYHRRVTERHYFLAGDLPNFDWQGLDDPVGKLTIYKRHMFLDRPPMTVHGLTADHASITGSEFLVWNNGQGTSLWDPAAAAETVEVSPGVSSDENDSRFTSPRMLNADRIVLQAHPAVPHWQRSIIAPPIEFLAAVTLIVVPPSSAPPFAVSSEEGASGWLFVVSGDFIAVLAGGGEPDLAIHLREGSFLDIQAGDTIRCVRETTNSERGCTLIAEGFDFQRS